MEPQSETLKRFLAEIALLNQQLAQATERSDSQAIANLKAQLREKKNSMNAHPEVLAYRTRIDHLKSLIQGESKPRKKTSKAARASRTITTKIEPED